MKRLGEGGGMGAELREYVCMRKGLGGGGGGGGGGGRRVLVFPRLSSGNNK